MRGASIAALLFCACGLSNACGTGGKGETTVKPAPPVVDAAPELGVAIGDGRVDARLVNQPGELIELDRLLVADKVTVVDFWAEWCGACKVMEEKLYEVIADKPGIAVRKLDIVDDVSPVALHYRVGRMLPEMRIYKGGKLVHQLIGNDCLKAGALALELAGDAATAP